jgi:uncharacterized membrane protein
MTTATLFEDEASTEGRRSGRPRLVLQRAAAAVRDPVVAVTAGMITVWSATFIVLGWIRHDHFATLGFDLGIYDQAIWLLSRFKDPFITIRGLEFFGHHMNPALMLFVPFYWLGAGPKFLLVVQVLAQASGAIAVYLLARDRLGDRWLAVVLAAVLLLNPTYQYLTWEYFHPDALAIAPLLFAYWAARAKRWRWFAVAAVLALACKEDVALVMVVMGVLIAVRGDRRVGAIVAVGSAIWFAFATRVLIPAANGIGPFYDSFFGDFGKTPTDIVKNVVTHPGKTLDIATRPDRTSYYRMMFAPVAFLPFAALGTLLLAGPMLGINALSTFPYQREIRYHYAAMVLVGIILATVEGIAIVGWNPGLRRFLVGLVAATSLATTVAWGPSPISTKFRSGLWPLGADTRLATKKAAVDLIPSGAATSSLYNFDTHLAHREKIYEFPVPWRSVNWGVHDENLDNPAGVRWIIVDRNGLGDRDKALLESLLSGQFETRFDRDGIVVAKRVRAAQPGEPGKGGQV